MKLAILSNTNISFIIESVAKNFSVYSADGFANFFTTIYDSNSELYSEKHDFIILIFDLLDIRNSSPFEEIGKLEVAIKQIRDRFKNTTIIVNNVVLPMDRINLDKMEKILSYYNSMLSRLEQEYNIKCLDFKKIALNIGLENFFSKKMWYSGSIPYSLKASKLIANQICRLCSPTARKKVLAIDLDNTIWGGVVGEDGEESLELSNFKRGAIFQDTQRLIKELKETGVLLAVVSKNNLEDAVLPFEKNPSMILEKSDFVSFKANWQDKSDNLLEIAKELNLGLDSFVFLDDNPVEREAVKARLKEVTVLPFEDDLCKLPESILKAFEDYFYAENISSEDSLRTDYYLQNTKRQQLKASITSIEDYLGQLKIKVVVGEIEQGEIDRVLELTNKTNQCNLTTKRLTLSELKEYKGKGDNRIFVAYSSDIYGDNGLIAVAYLTIKGKNAFVENFLMSCRVMGRQIEQSIFVEIEDNLKEAGVETIHLKFIKSSKNTPASKLPKALGYKPVKLGEEESLFKKKIVKSKKTSFIETKYRK